MQANFFYQPTQDEIKRPEPAKHDSSSSEPEQSHRPKAPVVNVDEQMKEKIKVIIKQRAKSQSKDLLRNADGDQI